MEKLTPRQAAFVREYAKDNNGTQAAIRAGYSKLGANVHSTRLLSNEHIKSLVNKAKQAAGERALVETDRIIQELERIAFGDPRDLMTWGPEGVKLKPSADLTEAQAAMVVEVSEKVNQAGFKSLSLKRADKLRALAMLAEYDPNRAPARKEVSGPGGKPIEVANKTWLDVVNEEISD